MKFGVPWHVKGVRPQARETAREAARRAGMSVGEWLDTVITDSAYEAGVETARRTRADYVRGPDEDAEGRYPAHDQEGPVRRPYADLAEPLRRDPHEHLAEVGDRLEALTQQLAQHRGPGSDENLAEIRDRLEILAEQLDQDDRNSPSEHLAAVNERLDVLAQQLDRLAAAQEASAESSSMQVRDEETPHQLVSAISRIDGRLDQLIAEGRAATSEIERRMSAVDRVVSQLDRERARPAAVAANPLDQALAEIAERQRALDGEPPRSHSELPRAPTQDLSSLEQQLRDITSRVETLRPCGIDSAVETLRDDLAEIGLMLKEAMPRNAVEALENEVRALAERIDDKRQWGGDTAAVAGIERGLAEVRDALRALTPAENLAGFDETVRDLTRKVDRLAASNQDPAAFEQLESAIVGLRGVVSHVASNDALTALSNDVRTLAAKIEQIASGPDILATLEQRIATMADALQARHQPASEARDVDALMQGISERIEQLQLTRTDHTAVSHLEDRIVKLVEKLDASDARFSNLEAIERGLKDLLVHLEQQRAAPAAHLTNIELPEVDVLKREVRRTQDSLEAVHGTLGHVVDRLAMIETGIRGATTAQQPKADTEPMLLDRIVSDRADKDPRKEPVTASPPLQAAPPMPADVPAPPLVPSEPQAPAAVTAAGQPAKSDRRPIDPSLPPDHPLEPGLAVRARTGTSAADRIAASEAALGLAKPPVIPDAASKSNFIAAARRAAQAASGAATVREKRTSSSADGSGTGRRLSDWFGGRTRSILVAASVVAIVLGSLQLAMTLFGPRHQADEAAPAEATQPVPEGDTPAPSRTNAVPTPAPAAPAPSAPGRQSVLLPGAGTLSFGGPDAGVMLPGEPASAATSAPKTTEPAPADLLVTPGARSPNLASASSRPAEPTSAQPAAPGPASARLSDADKLPAGIGGAGLRAAAVRGDAAAEYEIAVRFAEGRGVPQDLTAAAEWFERAAKQGVVMAQFRLGALYEKGMGVKKSTESARRLYAAAGEAGNAKAIHNLAVLYAEGVEGKPDYQTAAKWFRKAADYGVADSQYNLGILYARGIGIEPNLAEAYKWFALAAREGDKEAAKKRDDIGAQLDQASLMAARAAVQVWTAEPQPEIATLVKAPAGGWDAAPLPAAGKRRAGSKTDAGAQAAQ